MTKRKVGEEVYKDLTAPLNQSKEGVNNATLDDSLARFISRLDQIINRAGGGTPVSTIAESPKTTQQIKEASQFAASVGILDVSVKSLRSAIDKLANSNDKLASKQGAITEKTIKDLMDKVKPAPESDSVQKAKTTFEKWQAEQASKKVSIEELIPNQYGRGDTAKRAELINTISGFEDKQKLQQIRSRVHATHPEVLASFGEALSNKDVIENLGEIWKYGRMPSDKVKEGLRGAAKGGSTELKEYFDKLNSGSQSVNKFTSALTSSASAITMAGAQLLATAVNYQTSLLNNPYTSATDKMGRDAQQRMDITSNTIAGVAGTIASLGVYLSPVTAGLSLPVAGTLAAGIGMLGYSLGKTAGGYGAAYKETHSEEYKNNIREVMGYAPSDEQLENFHRITGTTNYNRLAGMTAPLRGILGGKQAVGAVTNIAASKYKEIGQALNMPNLSQEGTANIIAQQIMLSRLTGMKASDTISISNSTGVQGSEVLRGAASLSYAPSVVSGRNSIGDLTSRYTSLSNRSQVSADTYAEYENKGMIGQLTQNALSQAFLGMSADEVFKGISDRSLSREDLATKSTVPIELLKEIAPDVYKEVMGATEDKEDPAKQTVDVLKELLKSSDQTNQILTEQGNKDQAKQDVISAQMNRTKTKEFIKQNPAYSFTQAIGGKLL